MSEGDNNITTVELLHMVARLAAAAESAEAKAAAALSAQETAEKSTQYWLSEVGRMQNRVKELERQVENLSSPLAELARASKEGG